MRDQEEDYCCQVFSPIFSSALEVYPGRMCLFFLGEMPGFFEGKKCPHWYFPP